MVTQAAMPPCTTPYLLILQPPQCLGDELDVLGGECGQLTVLRPQVHILWRQWVSRREESLPVAH